MFHLRCLPVQPQSFPVVALNHFLKASLFSAPMVRATVSPSPLSSGLATIANAFAHSGHASLGIGAGKIELTVLLCCDLSPREAISCLLIWSRVMVGIPCSLRHSLRPPRRILLRSLSCILYRPQCNTLRFSEGNLQFPHPATHRQ